MTNYEWIKGLNIDEMATLVCRNWDTCIFGDLGITRDCLYMDRYTGNTDCKECIREWLNEERKPVKPKTEMDEFIEWLKMIEDGSIIEDCTAITIHDIREKIDCIRNKGDK